MEKIISSHWLNGNFLWPIYLWRMVRHPIQTGQEIVTHRTTWRGLAVVVVFGLYLTLGCFSSYLDHDYPPSPEELHVWVETWGKFAMLPLPFLPIPMEQYRLFMAVISLPVVICSWLYMAAVARLLTGWFGGGTNFKQYLNLFAFSFFPFWLLSSLGDWFFSTGLHPYIIPGLRGDYGLFLQTFFITFPPLLYTVLFSTAAVYNGIAAYSASIVGKRLRWWEAVLIGWTTFLLPLLLVVTLYR